MAVSQLFGVRESQMEPLPTWCVIACVSFGLLFTVFHVFWAVEGLRYARSRDQRLEAAGAAVPGLAGLMLVAAAVAAPGLISIVFAVASVPLMVLGRAMYELLVFSYSRTE